MTFYHIFLIHSRCGEIEGVTHQSKSKKGEKTYMEEVLGLTGSVSCLVKNKNKYHNY